MSNPPTPAPAPGWWINFLRSFIIRPWLGFKRRMRAARQRIWRMIKAPFRLLSRKPKQAKELREELTDAVTDSIPGGNSRVGLDKPGRHSSDSIIADLPSGGTGGGSYGARSGTSDWSPGGSGMLDGCGDGCDGCDGCAFDLMMMTFGVVAISGAVLYRLVSSAVRKL